jgi:hypothetical protein
MSGPAGGPRTLASVFDVLRLGADCEASTPVPWLRQSGLPATSTVIGPAPMGAMESAAVSLPDREGSVAVTLALSVEVERAVGLEASACVARRGCTVPVTGCVLERVRLWSQRHASMSFNLNRIYKRDPGSAHLRACERAP